MGSLQVASKTRRAQSKLNSRASEWRESKCVVNVITKKVNVSACATNMDGFDAFTLSWESDDWSRWMELINQKSNWSKLTFFHIQAIH